MALVLNEEQRMLKDTAREFIQANAPVEAFRKLRDENDPLGYAPALWEHMVELGWASMCLPEAYGGFDFSFTGLGAVIEEAGATLACSPLFSTVVLGAHALLLGGSDAHKDELLPRVAGGELLLALALEDSHHHDPAQTRLEATADGDGWRLNGEKRFVVDGHIAHKLIVVARTSGEPGSTDGLTLFLVNADADGVDCRRTSMVDHHNAALVNLSNVAVAQDDVLGTVDEGFAVLDPVLDRGRIAIACDMLGGMDAMFQRTMDYLKEREQFGVKIGSFQALKHRSADMFIEIELCRSVILEALNTVEEHPEQLAEMASLVKSHAGETYLKVTDEAVQMHGGIGVTDELDVGLFLKRSRVLNQLLGDPGFHRRRYARLMGY